MSLVAVVNLAERLLNHTSDQGQNSATGSAAKPNASTQSGISQAAFEDQFTSSVANGTAESQEAGLFRATGFAIFSAAANFFLSQRSSPAADAPQSATATKSTAPVAAASVPVTPPPASSGLANASSNTAAQVLNLGGPTPIGAPAATAEVAPATSIPQTASTSSSTQGSQAQLQELNSALTVLGLSYADITLIDRIANLIQDFNPAAYASLVQQLQALAQSQSVVSQRAPSSGPSAAVPASSTASSGASAGTPTGKTNGLQIQELNVKFAAINETVQSGNGASGSTIQVSGFNLQIQGVRLTFTNGSGQTVQVETPEAGSSAATGNANATAAKARAAAA